MQPDAKKKAHLKIASNNIQMTKNQHCQPSEKKKKHPILIETLRGSPKNSTLLS
jgi:hypothetical protein